MILRNEDGSLGLREIVIAFEEFWRGYPRKVGRIKAEKIWLKLPALEKVLAIRRLEMWKQTAQWQSQGGMFIPYASTFLAQKRYLDEPWSGAFEDR